MSQSLSHCGFSKIEIFLRITEFSWESLRPGYSVAPKYKFVLRSKGMVKRVADTFCGEGGIMAAVGQLRPPWSIDARNRIEQKTSPPSPFLPSAPPPPPRIMPPWWAESADAKKQPIRCGGCRYDGLDVGRPGQGVRVKLANLPSKNTHHKQINRPDWRCANDNMVAGTGDQDKNGYAEGPQDHLLSGNTISPLLDWVSHAAVVGVWSTNSYLKYQFVPADGISKLPQFRGGVNERLI